MLNKKNRIPRNMFSLFRVSSVRFDGSDVFSIKFLENQKKGKRFCFSISKKITKKSFLRNKIRRWGYLEIKDYLDNLKDGIIALFIFKKIPQNRTEIKENLKYLLKKNKLIL